MIERERGAPQKDLPVSQSSKNINIHAKFTRINNLAAHRFCFKRQFLGPKKLRLID